MSVIGALLLTKDNVYFLSEADKNNGCSFAIHNSLKPSFLNSLR